MRRSASESSSRLRAGPGLPDSAAACNTRPTGAIHASRSRTHTSANLDCPPSWSSPPLESVLRDVKKVARAGDAETKLLVGGHGPEGQRNPDHVRSFVYSDPTHLAGDCPLAVFERTNPHLHGIFLGHDSPLIFTRQAPFVSGSTYGQSR